MLLIRCLACSSIDLLFIRRLTLPPLEEGSTFGIVLDTDVGNMSLTYNGAPVKGSKLEKVPVTKVYPTVAFEGYGRFEVHLTRCSGSVNVESRQHEVHALNQEVKGTPAATMYASLVSDVFGDSSEHAMVAKLLLADAHCDAAEPENARAVVERCFTQTPSSVLTTATPQKINDDVEWFLTSSSSSGEGITRGGKASADSEKGGETKEEASNENERRYLFPAHLVISGYRILGRAAELQKRYLAAEGYYRYPDLFAASRFSMSISFHYCVYHTCRLALEELATTASDSVGNLHPHALHLIDKVVGVVMKQNRDEHASKYSGCW